MCIPAKDAKISKENLLILIDNPDFILYNPINDGILPAKYFQTLL